MADLAYKIILGDQKTDEWQKLREGVAITGSNAKKVKGVGNAYLYETLAMMTTKRVQKDLKGIADIDRGNELEPEAREKYTKETGQLVAQCAFIENGRYGISPDGLVYKKKQADGIKKLVEIKCPDTNNHIRYILENKLPAEHKDQVIHGFIVVDDCDEIDFVSYDPKFKLKPLHIITIRRSDLIVDISTTRIQYEKFIEKLDQNYSKLIS